MAHLRPSSVWHYLFSRAPDELSSPHVVRTFHLSRETFPLLACPTLFPIRGWCWNGKREEGHRLLCLQQSPLERVFFTHVCTTFIFTGMQMCSAGV